MTQASEQARNTAMFDDIAPHYDFLNHFLSFHIDKIWRRKAAKQIAFSDPRTILDIATGTGDMSLQLAKRCPRAQITGIDLSESMLDIAKDKIARKGLGARIQLTRGNACRLPFPNESFDAISIAFGVRNFADLESGLSETYRVLNADGSLAILEFSTPTTPIWKASYNLYFHKILPVIGRIVSHNATAYTYLPSSVERFPNPDTFIYILKKCGLECTRRQRLAGGIASLYVCKKRQDTT